uniref:Uncharacterized protein n=1 Tax=Avena sativa TaxID=4498 RepID=A0ACD5YBW2_AVESA
MVSATVATEAPLVHVAFSSGASHFVACTATGLHVFSCDDSVERVHCRCNAAVASGGGEVASAELLTRSNLAVVVRRPNGASAVHALQFLDGMCGETIAVKPVGTPGLGAVGGVRLLGDHVLVAGEKSAMLGVKGDPMNNNAELKTTGPNPLGLCALAIDQATLVYALPREEKGAVQVCRSGSPDASVDVHAHESSLACIALSPDGRLLATAGSKGTLVRIFSTHDGSKLQELRRGTDRADIHCIAFSPDSKWLAVSSDKATVHVFMVAVDLDLASSTPESEAEQKQNAPEEGGQAVPAAPAAASTPAPAKANKGSSLSFLKGYLPSYFSSEWSLAQFRLPEGVSRQVLGGVRAATPQHRAHHRQRRKLLPVPLRPRERRRHGAAGAQEVHEDQVLARSEAGREN